MLKKHKPHHPLTGPEAAVTSALPPPPHHPHFLETSETKSLPPAAHFISSLRKLVVIDSAVVLRSCCVPSGCGSSGFRSKRPPDSCWVSAWPSPCTQTAPGSSSRQGRDWSGSCPGESGPPNITTKLVRTFQVDAFTVSSLKAMFAEQNQQILRDLRSMSSKTLMSRLETVPWIPWNVHTGDGAAGCWAGRFSGGSECPPGEDKMSLYSILVNNCKLTAICNFQVTAVFLQ